MTRTTWRVLGSLLLLPGVACDVAPIISPIIDRPPDGTQADPFTDLDTLELTVAVAGARDDLTTAIFARGDAVEVAGVDVTSNIVVHLVGRDGQAEIAYGRTCAFDGAIDPSPHLYFARTVRWAPMPGMSAPTRTQGAAIGDAAEGVLLLGGADAQGVPVTAVERFAPLDGAFATIGTTSPRLGAQAATLGNGRVILVGGTLPDGAAPGFFESISPTAAAGRAVERIDSAVYDLHAGGLATLADGRAVAIGGRGVDDVPRGTVVSFGDEDGIVVARKLDATLAVPRAEHTATRISDDLGAPVLVIGGVDATGGPVAVAELYRPLRGEFASGATFGPRLLVPRSHHQVIRTPDGGLLVVGGIDAQGLPVHQLELFSIDAGFTDAGQLPDGAGVVDASVTALPDGRILIAGGRTTLGGPPVAATFIARIDPVDGSVDVVPTDALDEPRAGHGAALLCDGTVLVTGGSSAASAAERYNPPPAGRR